ncbi:hypothetical protein IVB23_36360 [Bradyrhizobium sp. 191]|nr:hypothetical protein [Bradyrhizobium sp. 191]UPJ65329.1 hypothetical protein IVB23_36360 [Bradyrhizobium sp. 191]
MLLLSLEYGKCTGDLTNAVAGLSVPGVERIVDNAHDDAVAEQHHQREQCRRNAEPCIEGKEAEADDREECQPHDDPSEDSEHSPLRHPSLAG